VLGQGWRSLLVVAPFHGGHRPSGMLVIGLLLISICPQQRRQPPHRGYHLQPNLLFWCSRTVANRPVFAKPTYRRANHCSLHWSVSSRPVFVAPTHRQANHRFLRWHGHSLVRGVGLLSHTCSGKSNSSTSGIAPGRSSLPHLHGSESYVEGLIGDSPN
jgi:hypothetical protein